MINNGKNSYSKKSFSDQILISPSDLNDLKTFHKKLYQNSGNFTAVLVRFFMNKFLGYYCTKY